MPLLASLKRNEVPAGYSRILRRSFRGRQRLALGVQCLAALPGTQVPPELDIERVGPLGVVSGRSRPVPRKLSDSSANPSPRRVMVVVELCAHWEIEVLAGAEPNSGFAALNGLRSRHQMVDIFVPPLLWV